MTSATDNRTTLLPCPFCGGKATLRMSWMEDGHRYRAVECVECGATTPGNYSEVGDQSVWDWNTRTPEQAIAATLGSGTLTAEQVEKAIHDCSTYASYDGCTYYASGIRLQAIADELNAAIGGGECEIVYHYEARDRSEIGREPVELSCGHIVERHSKYCQECGRKIRKAVKR